MKRALLLCTALVAAGGTSAATPDADLLLVNGTVTEVDGCSVYTQRTFGDRLVAFTFTCNRAELADPDWINGPGMGIGRGDCVDFQR